MFEQLLRVAVGRKRDGEVGATEVVLCGVGFEVGYALRSKQTCITAVCPLDRSGIKLSSGRVCLSVCGVGIHGVGGGDYISVIMSLSRVFSLL